MEDFFFVPAYVAHAPTNLQEDSIVVSSEQ
jgi:uncharacterized RmlC-like cupin family protein